MKQKIEVTAQSTEGVVKALLRIIDGLESGRPVVAGVEPGTYKFWSVANVEKKNEVTR